MVILGMTDRPQPESAVRHFVEDDRPDSGHMQIQNRSPATGFFEPSVQLGDAIRVGDCIGRLTDVRDDAVIEIISTQDGIVLGLQTFSRVLKGESVCVIMETQM